MPMWLVMARASDMNLSIPRISAIPATGMPGTTARVAANVMNPDPVTPVAPLLVIMATTNIPICWPRVSSMPMA